MHVAPITALPLKNKQQPTAENAEGAAEMKGWLRCVAQTFRADACSPHHGSALEKQATTQRRERGGRRGKEGLVRGRKNPEVTA